VPKPNQQSKERPDQALKLLPANSTINPIMARLQTQLKTMVDQSKEVIAKRAKTGANVASNQDQGERGDNQSVVSLKTSSDEGVNPLHQEADRLAKYNRCSQETQILTREHLIFGRASLISTGLLVGEERAMYEQELQEESACSPWTNRLNLDLLNKDADQTKNEQQLFIDKANYLYKTEAPKKKAGIKFELFATMFGSKSSEMKKTRKFTTEQMQSMILERSAKVRDHVYNQVSHLVQMNVTSNVKVLEAMRPMQIDLKPISALFLKLPVSRRRPPLIAVFKDLQVNGGFDGSEEKDGSDVQVFWSYTNPFPCNGSDAEYDGSFSGKKVMKIGTGESKFAQAQIYLAIYARTQNFHDHLIYSFGRNALRAIEFREKLTASDSKGTPAEKNAAAIGKKEKEQNVYNHKLRLKQFSGDTQQNVERLLYDEEAWAVFQKQTMTIKDKLQVKKSAIAEHSPLSPDNKGGRRACSSNL